MAFVVDDIVKKTDGVQKYRVKEVLADSKYACEYEPKAVTGVSFTFKEVDLVIVE